LGQYITAETVSDPSTVPAAGSDIWHSIFSKGVEEIVTYDDQLVNNTGGVVYKAPIATPQID